MRYCCFFRAGISGKTGKPVYLIADIKVNDRQTYPEYAAKAYDIVKKYGGEYFIRGGKVIPVAGNWSPERIVLVKFKSFEAMRKWIGSAEYAAIAPLRERATVSKAIAVEGL